MWTPPGQYPTGTPPTEESGPLANNDPLTSSVLPDASKFVVDFVEILKEVEMHGLLSDACNLDACSVTDDLLRRSIAS